MNTRIEIINSSSLPPPYRVTVDYKRGLDVDIATINDKLNDLGLESTAQHSSIYSGDVYTEETLIEIARSVFGDVRMFANGEVYGPKVVIERRRWILADDQNMASIVFAPYNVSSEEAAYLQRKRAHQELSDSVRKICEI